MKTSGQQTSHQMFRKWVKNVVTSKEIQVGIEGK